MESQARGHAQVGRLPLPAPRAEQASDHPVRERGGGGADGEQQVPRPGPQHCPRRLTFNILELIIMYTYIILITNIYII